MLYEIGVRKAWRRRGVGRLLIEQMKAWMSQNGVAEAWVLADPDGAVAFYSASGFAMDDSQPVQMTLHV